MAIDTFHRVYKSLKVKNRSERMNMPGMIMHDNAMISGSGGRYTARIKPQVAGTWTAKLSFSGPQGNAEKTFPVDVKGGG